MRQLYFSPRIPNLYNLWTSNDVGAKRRLHRISKCEHTDTRTDGWTNRLIDWISAEDQFSENSWLEILNYFNFLDWIKFKCHSLDLLWILSQILTSWAVCSCGQAKYNLSTLASVFVCSWLPNDLQLWWVPGVWCLVQSANVQVGCCWPCLGPRGALDYLLITWWPLMAGLPLSTILPTTLLAHCAKAKEKEIK